MFVQETCGNTDCLFFLHEVPKGFVKKKNPELESSVSVPKIVTEAGTLTLCPKPEGSMFHSIKSLERQCSECGVHKLQLPTGKFLSNGQKKKIALVPKETPLLQLLAYFKEFLKGYMSHCFMAR